MSDHTPEPTEHPPAGDLSDFVQGYGKNSPLDIDVVVNEQGKVVLFHNLPFKKEISWFEFDLETNKLDFVSDEGEARKMGIALTPNMAKYMQNSHQILTVFMDNDTGEARNGVYIPLILHRS